MKYKYFLFDWDGTLGDTLPLWFPAYQETLKEFGVDTSYFEIGAKAIGDWNGPANFGINNSTDFVGKLGGKIMPAILKVRLNEGVKDVLVDIRNRGGKIAVVTTSKREWVEPALIQAGIRDMVDVFLGKEDVKNHKPDPEMFDKAILLVEGDKEQTLVIGDHKKDIEGAKNAGIKSVLYYPERHEKYYPKNEWESLGADFVIRDFRELEELL